MERIRPYDKNFRPTKPAPTWSGKKAIEYDQHGNKYYYGYLVEAGVNTPVGKKMEMERRKKYRGGKLYDIGKDGKINLFPNYPLNKNPLLRDLTFMVLKKQAQRQGYIPERIFRKKDRNVKLPGKKKDRLLFPGLGKREDEKWNKIIEESKKRIFGGGDGKENADKEKEKSEIKKPEPVGKTFSDILSKMGEMYESSGDKRSEKIIRMLMKKYRKARETWDKKYGYRNQAHDIMDMMAGAMLGIPTVASIPKRPPSELSLLEKFYGPRVSAGFKKDALSQSERESKRKTAKELTEKEINRQLGLYGGERKEQSDRERTKNEREFEREKMKKQEELLKEGAKKKERNEKAKLRMSLFNIFLGQTPVEIGLQNRIKAAVDMADNVMKKFGY